MREIELPESLEMEKKLISAMMLKDGEVIPDVSEKLKAEEFYREEHRCIYRAMLTLYSQGIPPDVLTIADELERTGELKKVRRDYLFALIDYEFTTTRAMKYVQSIKATAQRRQLMRLGEELLDDAGNSQKEISEIIAAAESKLYATTEDKVETTTDFTTLMTSTIDAANLRRKIGGRLLGASTGYAELNRLTCGLKKTDLIILAARPAMGKTALALNIAINAAADVPVGIFSLEMSAGQLGQRMMSIISGVGVSKIATGEFDDWDEMAMTNALAMRESLKIEIDDSTLTLSELRMRARRMKRKHNIGLIVIDYMQLIIGDKSYKGNRVQEVSDISRQLKAMAKELDIPILALSQLNRGSEMRADKRPQLSDLRESGSIEQDADIVMFIYRESYYNEDDDSHTAEIHVAKNRNGATGRCNLSFYPNNCRFYE